MAERALEPDLTGKSQQDPVPEPLGTLRGPFEDPLGTPRELVKHPTFDAVSIRKRRFLMVHSPLGVRHFGSPLGPFSDLCNRLTSLATFFLTFHPVLAIFLAEFVAALRKLWTRLASLRANVSVLVTFLAARGAKFTVQVTSPKKFPTIFGPTSLVNV